MGVFLLAGSSCEEDDDDRNDDESDNERPEPFHDRRQAQGCDDTYRAVSPEAVQMATSALR